MASGWPTWYVPLGPWLSWQRAARSPDIGGMHAIAAPVHQPLCYCATTRFESFFMKHLCFKGPYYWSLGLNSALFLLLL
jgi:hypothetical protein